MAEMEGCTGLDGTLCRWPLYLSSTCLSSSRRSLVPIDVVIRLCRGKSSLEACQWASGWTGLLTQFARSRARGAGRGRLGWRLICCKVPEWSGGLGPLNRGLCGKEAVNSLVTPAVPGRAGHLAWRPCVTSSLPCLGADVALSLSRSTHPDQHRLRLARLQHLSIVCWRRHHRRPQAVLTDAFLHHR